MFFLVFLCALLAGPVPDFTNLPQSQLTQETIPLLERELTIVETRVQAKKDFFSGNQNFTDAFWEFSGMDLFQQNVLNTQKNIVSVQYQRRLTQDFSNLVDEEIEPKISVRVSELVEQKWSAENEQDALNLRMLYLFSQKLQQHTRFVQQFNDIKNEHRQIRSLLLSLILVLLLLLLLLRRRLLILILLLFYC